MTSSAPQRTKLDRDGFTLNIYGYFMAWGWMVYAFSPAVPLIGEELGVSRAVAGLHGTSMAFGTITAGLTSGWLVRRFGRKAVLLAGAGILIIGVTILIFGPGIASTMTGAFLSSLGGPLTIVVSQSALSVHHRETGSAAISEGNGIAAAVGLIAPLAVGGAVGIGWGWRAAVGATAVLALVAALWTSRLAAPPALSGRSTARADDGARAKTHYGPAFWAFIATVVFGTAVENATLYWASDFIRSQTGAGEAIATAGVSGLVAGMFICRMAVGPISLRKAPEKLLLVAYTISIGGWFIFWIATSQGLAVVGLVVMGLGVGALYPMAVVLVIRASAGRPDQAVGMASLAVGVAIAIAPFALGALADAFSPKIAFLVVPGLAIGGIVAVLIGLRAVHNALRDQIIEAKEPQ